MNRTQMLEQMANSEEMAESFDDDDFDQEQLQTFGTAEPDITHAIDVTAVVAQKRAAMAAHASQISDDDFFLTLPDDAFAQAFGTEWYVDPRRPRDGRGLHDADHLRSRRRERPFSWRVGARVW